MIRKEDKLYRKDYSDSRWVELPLLSLESLDKLMVEMEPLTIFSFADLAEAKYAGKEKADGVKCRVYEIMTRGEHPWLIDYWEAVSYTHLPSLFTCLLHSRAYLFTIAVYHSR